MPLHSKGHHRYREHRQPLITRPRFCLRPLDCTRYGLLRTLVWFSLQSKCLLAPGMGKDQGQEMMVDVNASTSYFGAKL